MMYYTHELGRLALTPARMLASGQSKILRHRLNPLSRVPGTRSIASALKVFEDLTKRYPKPAFNLDTTVCDGETVLVNEVIVKRNPFCQLKHFQRNVNRPDDPKLLIVAPLSGHFASLLRGTVEAMLPNHDVYITDWRDASMVPISKGNFGLDILFDDRVKNCRAVEQSGGIGVLKNRKYNDESEVRYSANSIEGFHKLIKSAQ